MPTLLRATPQAGVVCAAACAFFVGPYILGDWAREELRVALDCAAKDRAFRLFLVFLPGMPELFDTSTPPPFLSMRTWETCAQVLTSSSTCPKGSSRRCLLCPGWPGGAACPPTMRRSHFERGLSHSV
jgi:hypothetical protein